MCSDQPFLTPICVRECQGVSPPWLPGGLIEDHAGDYRIEPPSGWVEDLVTEAVRASLDHVQNPDLAAGEPTS